MHLVITGGAGFLGVRLARTLLQRGTLALAGAAPQPITRLTLVDRAAPPADLTADARVQVVTGDLNELLTPDAHGTTRAVPADAQAVVHLAAAVSGECEADFDLGLRSNLDATRALLQACRHLKHITLLQHCTAMELLLDVQQRCVGANVRNADGQQQPMLASHTVLATGGMGQIYPSTTNPATATGDGIGQRAAFCLPDTPGRHTGHQHHGLGIGGQRQSFLGALLDQQTHILAQSLGGFGHCLSHDGMIPPAIQHAHGLRTLARKYKCEFLHIS